MPRKSTGKPHWKALAVKLPAAMIDEVRRYSDLHGISLSELIRQGLAMRLHGPQPANEYNGITILPTIPVAMLTRLATTLTTAAEQLRSACTGAMEAADTEWQPPPAPQVSTGNTAYNGYTRSEDSAPARRHDGTGHAQARAPIGQRKLSPRQVRALRDKRHRGVPIKALMEEYALSRASVFRYLQSEKR
jgi:hypothetical protein